MDLIDVSQIHQIICIKCQNSINQLTINEQQHNEIICERCLQFETKKYIYLNLEIQNYQRQTKEINQYSQKDEKKYNESFDKLQKMNYEENLTSVQYNEMNKELNDVQEKIKQETQEYKKLELQFLQIEQQQRVKIKEFHSQLIKIANIQERIAQNQSFIRDLQKRQKQIKEFSFDFDQQ